MEALQGCSKCGKQYLTNRKTSLTEETLCDTCYYAIEESGREKKGLGGWLIFLGMNIIAVPILSFVLFVLEYRKLFPRGVLYVLSPHGFLEYNLKFTFYGLGEMLFNLLTAATFVFIGYLFLNKKAIFPRWFIGSLIGIVCFQVVDFSALHILFPSLPLLDMDSIKKIIQPLCQIVIWNYYLKQSKRVHNTFVEPFHKVKPAELVVPQ